MQAWGPYAALVYPYASIGERQPTRQESTAKYESAPFQHHPSQPWRSSHDAPWHYTIDLRPWASTTRNYAWNTINRLSFRCVLQHVRYIDYFFAEVRCFGGLG